MIQYDFSKCGLTDLALEEFEAEYARVHEELLVERKAGEIGWWHLANDNKIIPQVRKKAREIQKRFDNLLVIGIGGSSQGLKAVATALNAWCNKPRLFVLENPDPRTAQNLLKVLNLKKTCINVISKSGGTIETLTLFEHFRRRWKKRSVKNGRVMLLQPLRLGRVSSIRW